MPGEILTLGKYVRDALDFFIQEGDYTLDVPGSGNTFVAGSQNGYLTGRAVYRFSGKGFNDNEEVEAIWNIDALDPKPDEVALVTATGSRNVIPLARHTIGRYPVHAIVCKDNSPLAQEFGSDIHKIYVPALEEPPTVNTSTYGNIIRGVTHENPERILEEVERLERMHIRFGDYSAITVLLPDDMIDIAGMAGWKCFEIFGNKPVRFLNYTRMMHGGGISHNHRELYIGLGVKNEYFGDLETNLFKTRESDSLDIYVPEDIGPLGFMMLSYALIGKIQEMWGDTRFNENIKKRDTSQWKWEPRYSKFWQFRFTAPE